MMKKESEKTTEDNSFGVVGVTFGILSIIISGAGGIIIGIIGLVFAINQNKKNRNNWSKAGIILSFIGIVIGIIVLVFAVTQLVNNPEILSQFQNLQG